mmetsp:Transcript_28880/g.46758  ORF Transcript_28880/g.46758 Transcript_28880/m.46758 type:complete len:84 (+) Transcript_28880:469-720(+)
MFLLKLNRFLKSAEQSCKYGLYAYIIANFLEAWSEIFTLIDKFQTLFSIAFSLAILVNQNRTNRDYICQGQLDRFHSSTGFRT